MLTTRTPKVLFGFKNWRASDWMPVTDQVRGGISTASLTEVGRCARFSGLLDTSTLGGAGFASVKFDKIPFNLDEFEGIKLRVAKSDGKGYTLNLTNEVSSKRADGRLESVAEFKCGFNTNAQEDAHVVTLPFAAFKPYYRGREITDPSKMPHLNSSNIVQVSIMMQSYFDSQKGEFEIDLEAIEAI
ncbi:NADH:ubiquinone oxidoreductase intermediate-associated protein 30 [Chytriomyces sp. MP71]|nr:NADH:ubiquinone oxidoreductase intermediate-associated protein 30 [Chytriomyces sp. MP71]